jgi:hypothetical protein
VQFGIGQLTLEVGMLDQQRIDRGGRQLILLASAEIPAEHETGAQP